MNPEEKIASIYLEQRGLGLPVFEPDGQIPPDFTLSQQIVAIEVTRLNRYLSANGITVAEENIYIPFRKLLKEVLSTFDGLYNGKSYLIVMDYVTLFSPSKSIKKQIYHKLKDFIASQDIDLPYVLVVNDDISLRILESKPIMGHTFISGSMNYDIRSIASLYIDNLRRCIAKKSNKIKPYKHKYPEWQLLLVDYMGWSLGIEEIKKIKTSITDLGLFDSLIVISYESKLLFSR